MTLYLGIGESTPHRSSSWLRQLKLYGRWQHHAAKSTAEQSSAVLPPLATYVRLYTRQLCISNLNSLASLAWSLAGDNFGPNNIINMAAVLFMWVVMPAFGAAAYVPSITLGELDWLWGLCPA